MKLIIVPLFLLIIIGASIQIINAQNPTVSLTGSTDTNVVNTGTVIINGTSQTGSNNIPSSVSFNMTVLVGFLAFFGAIVALGIISGLHISILGSTVDLSERSQNLIYNSAFYGGIWGIFSTLAIVGINSISLFSIPIFGIFIYMIMSLVYVLGINEQIQHSHGDS